LTRRISEEQALAFRARRHHLLGPGASGPVTAARAVVGIQAQVVAPALWSVAMRCAEPPTAEELGRAVETSTTLVRTWGQRDTVHLFDAAAHWRAIIRAIEEWPIGARGGLQPSRESIAAAEARVLGLDRPVTRSDLFDLVAEEDLAWMSERVGDGVPALRGVAGRFVWDMARRGLLCAGAVVDGEQAYDQRHRRFPGLDWPEMPAVEAGRVLVAGHLSANAPATVQDVAHFLGTRVSQARRLLASLQDELVPVECGDRNGLVVRRSDVDDLEQPLPYDWPPRLLPKFDTLLMSHADKSWTVPDEGERPEVWRRAAQVSATVLHRGRVVATWTHKALTRRVRIHISPLGGWSPGLEDELDPDARAFARHLGVDDVEIEIDA
jgi:hypothetical protein